MKLIEKTTLYFLIYTLFIFAIGTLLFYFLISNVIRDGIDEALHQEKSQIIENFAYESTVEFEKSTENIKIFVANKRQEEKDRYSTISLLDSMGIEVHYRQLSSVYKHGDKYYQIIIRQPLAETEALIQSLVPVEVVLFLILLAGVLMLSRQVSGNLWEPFYHLLEKLKNYNLTKTGIIIATKSNIDEFDDLSEGIEKMTQKIYNDYINQKEFNENSSHELQTPLAIIRNKLELLIQSNNLDENDLTLIQSIFDAVKRLTMLNKGLILLAKIDNEQYHNTEDINMEVFTSRILDNFKETMEEKEIKLTFQVEEECNINANPILIEILLNNLISNAIKHNFRKGKLELLLGEKYISISNTGIPLIGEGSKMFERFKKESTSENSVGLGLSIVKKICELSHFYIEYVFTNEKHVVLIKF